MHEFDPFDGLEPSNIWRHFAILTRIPRPSGREDLAADYVKKWAAHNGFTTEQDDVGNLCVTVPGRPGRESAPGVILQMHLDMVAERKPDAGSYDASEGRIHVVRGTHAGVSWIEADKTTLGADCGIACAAAMALAEDGEAVIGPLELLFTVQEETGLIGASQLAPRLVHGRLLMLNLDSENDDVLTVGSAGGSISRMVWRRPRAAVPADHVALKVGVFGLLGGHSGTDIHLGRINSIRALARLLSAGGRNVHLRLVMIEGGSRQNAIPRDAVAVVVMLTEDEPAFREGVEEARAEIDMQHQGREPEFRVSVELSPDHSARSAYDESDTQVLLAWLLAIPTGVLAISQEIPDTPETSNNLAVVRAEGETVEVTCGTRSFHASGIAETIAILKAAARLAGADFEGLSSYPGWRPNLSSTTLKSAKEAYYALHGNAPKISAVHAGLECGVIAARVRETQGGEMDVVSMGPTIVGPHAPGERVSIPSVAQFYEHLKATVALLSIDPVEGSSQEMAG